MRIGVDIDSVIANPIPAALAKAKQDYNVTLKKSDIIDWNFPIGDSHIGRIINRGMGKDDFVTSMTVIPGAIGALRKLQKAGHEIVLITARNSRTRKATINWLTWKNIPWDEIIFTRTGHKSIHGTAVLVDDYHENVIEFVENTDGFAFLFERPWNLAMHPYLKQFSRIRIIKRMSELPDEIEIYENLYKVTER